MDPQGPMGDQALTDDEKMKVGLQQAAIIEMSRDAELHERAMQQQMMLERQKEQDLMEAQQKALQMQQEQERLEQLQLMQQQAQVLQERQKEDELKRLQEQALMERQEKEVSGPSGSAGGQRIHPAGGMQPPPLSGPPGFPIRGQQPLQPLMSTSLPQQPPQSSQQQGPAPSHGAMPPVHSQPIQRPGAPQPLQRPPVSMAGGPPAFSQNQPPRGPRPMMQPPPPGISVAQGGPSGDQLGKAGESSGREGGPSFQHGGPPGDAGKRGVPPPLMSVETRPPTQRSEESKEGEASTKNEEEEPSEFKLPQALEKILAFKDVRAQEVGVKPEEMEKIEKGELIQEEELEDETQEKETGSMSMEDYEEEEDEEPTESVNKTKESKNKKRKKKKKKAKQRKGFQPSSMLRKPDYQTLVEQDDVEIEYIPEEPMLLRTDPSYREFSKIFKAFKIEEPEVSKEQTPKVELTTAQKVEGELGIKARAIKELGEDDQFEGSGDEEEVDDKPKLSKKKMKKLNRLSVAELKQLVTRPDVVEMHDVTARDPKLLINLKATRNTVPVPRHWCFKRKYLQGKRGIEKPPFDLPDFIKNTGIMEMRQALQEKEEAKNLKAKMREKVRPKMGKIDIDYQKLHDAFFKYQTKPKMAIHGDLYYEGKEFETRLKEKKPGNLTDDLRTALGMPLGPNADKYPPPWLIAMQRYGPPPSYPNLKIAGLNGPIPEGCSFGYHAGGWGKPPVDENGKPLYGDVFGTQGQETAPEVEEEDVDKTRWGELESESEEESESESESEEEREAMESGLITPGDTGLVTPSGVTSVPVGMETPDMIELRKKRIEDAMDQGGDTPALYQVIPEKKAAVGAAMMGSAHVYDISAVAAPVPARGADNAEGVEVVLNPDELDMDTAAMQAKYEQQVREQQSQLEKEDLSDMVADHAAKQAKKRKKQQQDTSKAAKKYKDFKF